MRAEWWRSQRRTREGAGDWNQASRSWQDVEASQSMAALDRRRICNEKIRVKKLGVYRVGLNRWQEEK